MYVSFLYLMPRFLPVDVTAATNDIFTRKLDISIGDFSRHHHLIISAAA